MKPIKIYKLKTKLGMRSTVNQSKRDGAIRCIIINTDI